MIDSKISKVGGYIESHLIPEVVLAFPKPIKIDKGYRRNGILVGKSYGKPKKRSPTAPSKRVKRKKLPSIKSLKAKADLTFSKWIRNRDRNVCFIGKSDGRYKCKGAIQCGHLFKRGKMSLRYSEINCHAICSHHNYLDNYEPQHYISAFLKSYGEDQYQWLMEKSKEIKQMKRFDYEEIIKHYENKK